MAAAPASCHWGLTALIARRSCGRHRRSEQRSVESIESRTAGERIVAIVSLHNQRITIYDATGWILRAPMSIGRKGRDLSRSSAP
jgi:hypothetical protein